ncbi:hypothetical protein BD779DRAFT_381017 [Infundibulicybe gibba]|nr:hypothetical protein BD779DRAFT_381017 [Infundibulicybe gibba]
MQPSPCTIHITKNWPLPSSSSRKICAGCAAQWFRVVSDPFPMRMPSTPLIKMSPPSTPKLSPKSEPSSSLPPSPSSRRSHVPRPPNAFMLYRSDFLKRGIIPSHVERRQQHLSRVAGECWNLLSPEEKAQWQERAAKVLEEHQRRNPDYKFSPAPRGTRRAKGKTTRPDGETTSPSDRIRQIREEYTRIAGPAATPSRQRRTRSKPYSSDTEKDKTSVNTMLPRSLPASPISSPAPTPGGSQFLFSQYPFPQVVAPRRPSTSLGFFTPSEVSNMNQVTSLSGFSLSRPASAAPSDASLFSQIHDLDLPIGSEAANFRDVSMPTPTMAAPSFATPFIESNFDFSTIRTQTPFNTPLPELSPTQPNPSSQTSETHLQDAKDTSLFGSLYSNDAFPGILSFDKPEFSLFDESWFSNSFSSTEADVWDQTIPRPQPNTQPYM